jgi:hypothetical protein
MKRMAALAALLLALLAIPAAAMASSGSGGGSVSSGPGYGPPRAVQAACPFPARLLKGRHKVQVVIKGRTVRVDGKIPPKILVQLLRHGKKGRVTVVFRHGKKGLVTIVCPFPPGPPFCLGPVLRFDMASGSSTLTEVSGPTLSPTQTFVYDGNSYTIMSVNPGADSFTVFLNGIMLFTNHGAAIANGTGFMPCGR